MHANQPACPLWPLRWCPNVMSTYRGVIKDRAFSVIMKTDCETDGSSPALVVAGAEAGAQAELWAGPQAELPTEAGHGAGHPVQPGDDQWS